MERKYILIITCASAGLLAVVALMVIVIRQCRKRNVTGSRTTIKDSPPRRIQINTLDRETHLIHSTVGNDTSLSSFKDETVDASNTINGTALANREADKNVPAISDRKRALQIKEECGIERDITKSGDENETANPILSMGFHSATQNREMKARTSPTRENNIKNYDTHTKKEKKPMSPPAAGLKFRHKHDKTVIDSITPVQSDVSQQTFCANDYEEIQELIQHTKAAVNVPLTSTETETVKDSGNDKQLIGAVCQCQSTSAYTQSSRHKQMDSINTEILSVLGQRNASIYENAPKCADSSCVPDDDDYVNDDSLKFYTDYIKEEDREDSEHVYSSLD